MDYELLVRTALLHKIKFVDHVFSKYRLHEESKTNNNLSFCKDWNLIFSGVLNSFKNSEKLIEKFTELDFYTPQAKKFHVNNNYSSHNIQKAFLYHLQIILHYYYNDLGLKKVKQIAKVIKTTSPSFYKQQRIARINFRSTVMSKYLITLMRNLTRS